MAKKISHEPYFTFDDVLIRPGRSAIEPSESSLEVTLAGLRLTRPFLSAAMDRVTDARMAVALAQVGSIGVLHRNCTPLEQVAMLRTVKKHGAVVAAACGPFDGERAKALVDGGVDMLVIDCAHGGNLRVIDSVANIKQALPTVPFLVGNIATKESVVDLVGVADIVKVGVGPGSICTTRIVSGVGVPQLSAILEVATVAKKHKMQVIADGGMRNSGDIAKALAAGADAVMLGNMFAGTKEAPGKIVTRNGKKFKEYRGMGSAEVLAAKQSNDRYLTHGRKAVAEGVSGYVPYKGPVVDIVETLASGVQVAMGYVGSRTIADFHRQAQFIHISAAAIYESRPHTLFDF